MELLTDIVFVCGLLMFVLGALIYAVTDGYYSMVLRLGFTGLMWALYWRVLGPLWDEEFQDIHPGYLGWGMRIAFPLVMFFGIFIASRDLLQRFDRWAFRMTPSNHQPPSKEA
jgi:hypothetical protein